MTRKEAIDILAESKRQNEVLRDNPSTLWASRQMTDGVKNAERRIAALDMALSALRPVSREQVEKVWGSCKVCNGEMTLYQHMNTTKLYMDTFGKAATLVTECNACPPYAKCCMKGVSANSAFKINFCPECGRPLTDEAWEKLDGIREKMEREAEKEE